MECPECGQLSPDGVKKCVWCGAEMGADDAPSAARALEDRRAAASPARVEDVRRAADLDERERILQEREQALKEAELAARERILREREKAARENARRYRWEEEDEDEDEEDEPTGKDYSQRIGGRGAMGIVFFVTLALFILYMVYAKNIDISDLSQLATAIYDLDVWLFALGLIASFWGWVRPDFGDAVFLVICYVVLFFGGVRFALIPAVLSLYCAVRFKDFQDRTRAAKRSARRKKKRKLSRDQRRVLDSATDAELGRAYRRAIKNGGSVVVEFDEDEEEDEE